MSITPVGLNPSQGLGGPLPGQLVAKGMNTSEARGAEALKDQLTLSPEAQQLAQAPPEGGPAESRSRLLTTLMNWKSANSDPRALLGLLGTQRPDALITLQG